MQPCHTRVWYVTDPPVCAHETFSQDRVCQIKKQKENYLANSPTVIAKSKETEIIYLTY